MVQTTQFDSLHWKNGGFFLSGMVMTAAWLLLSSIGIITARYNKQILKRFRLFGTQIWFQVHVILYLVTKSLLSVYIHI